MNTTAEQREKLDNIRTKLRAIALEVGPMHCWWDYISDIDAVLAGRKPMLTIDSVDAFIAKLESLAR